MMDLTTKGAGKTDELVVLHRRVRQLQDESVRLRSEIRASVRARVTSPAALGSAVALGATIGLITTASRKAEKALPPREPSNLSRLTATTTAILALIANVLALGSLVRKTGASYFATGEAREDAEETTLH
ncbi:MAG: hypothetical protein ACREXT_03280 [Gammaproteobacteria bacterium]